MQSFSDDLAREITFVEHLLTTLCDTAPLLWKWRNNVAVPSLLVASKYHGLMNFCDCISLAGEKPRSFTDWKDWKMESDSCKSSKSPRIFLDKFIAQVLSMDHGKSQVSVVARRFWLRNIFCMRLSKSNNCFFFPLPGWCKHEAFHSARLIASKWHEMHMRRTNSRQLLQVAFFNFCDE